MRRLNIQHLNTLILTNIALPISYDEMLFEQTKHILTITQIYHLNISQKDISIFVLVRLLSLLHDLITLKIHSFLLEDPITATTEDLLIFYSVKRKSKISKVYVEEIDHIQQLNFLFNLRPVMEYFKVRCINTIDILSFLRTIVKKINYYGCNHLRSLCVNVRAADDRMVENIKDIIKCEKLFDHFIVKRVRDDIYLQCK